MFDFKYFTPTKVVFGKNTESKVADLIKEFGGTKVLVHYGGGSVVRSGLLKRVTDTLDAAGINYETFMRYFSAAQQANAIKIGKLHVLNTPLSLVRLRRNKTPPQSFLYLTESQSEKVKEKAAVREGRNAAADEEGRGYVVS